MRGKIDALCVVCMILCFLSACGNKESIYDNKDAFYWKGTNIAACEEGYFLCQDDQYETDYQNEKGEKIPSVNGFQVFFYDIESKKLTAWCDRADCTHSNIFCNSFFKSDEWLQQVYCYNDKVYMISKDEDYFYLEEFEKNGRDKKRIGEIALISDFDISYGIRLCNNKLYYSNRDDGLYEKDLNLKNEKRLVDYGGSTLNRNRTVFYGNKVYYGLLNKEDEKYSVSINSMNLDTEQTEHLADVDALLLSLAFDGKNIAYYIDGEGLYYYDTEKNENRLAYSDKGVFRDVFFDGKNFVIENSRACVEYWNKVAAENEDPGVYKDDNSYRFEIIAADGTLDSVITEENISGFVIAYFGDERYFFMKYVGNDDDSMHAYDRTKTGEDGKWELLDWSREHFDYSKDAIIGIEPVESETMGETEGEKKQPLMNEAEYESLASSIAEKADTCFKSNWRVYLGNRLYYIGDVTSDSGYSIYSYDYETGENKAISNENKTVVFEYAKYGTAIYSDGGRLFVPELYENDWFLSELDTENGNTERQVKIGSFEELYWNYNNMAYEGVSQELYEKYFSKLDEETDRLNDSTKKASIIYMDCGKVIVARKFGNELALIDISSGNEEILYSNDTKGWGRVESCSYISDDSLYFALYGDGKRSLAKVDMEKGNSLEKINTPKGAYIGESGYALVDHEIYFYEPGNGIVKINSAGEKSLFCRLGVSEFDDSACRLEYDGKFLYLGAYDLKRSDSTWKKIFVLDMSGNVCGIIDMESLERQFNDVMEIDDCENDHIRGMYIIYTSNKGEKVKRCILNKKKYFTTGEIEWIKLL